MTVKKCYLNQLGVLCAAGNSVASVADQLKSNQSPLTMSDQFSSNVPLPLGKYEGELPTISLTAKKWQSRNNQFALAALQQIEVVAHSLIEKYGVDRVGVIIGTSTSGIAESETVIKQWVEQGSVPESYDYGVQEMCATADFVAEYLGVQGPVYGISTACSSGAKALASARRLIQADVCDVVIAGGVDTLCHLTVQGFSSLEAVSDEQCNPFSKNRKGINIGEGAALFIVSQEAQGVELLGTGEGSDAHHISAPDPSGAGAIRCMQRALDDGGVEANDVDYVNLHGTATSLNDQMESTALNAVFGAETLCSSTKPFTGHTLGAAGAVEAGLCWMILADQMEDYLPIQLWDGVPDPDLPPINLVSSETRLASPANYVLSNSFAFGGNNISLLFGRVQ